MERDCEPPTHLELRVYEIIQSLRERDKISGPTGISVPTLEMVAQQTPKGAHLRIPFNVNLSPKRLQNIAKEADRIYTSDNTLWIALKSHQSLVSSVASDWLREATVGNGNARFDVSLNSCGPWPESKGLYGDDQTRMGLACCGPIFDRGPPDSTADTTTMEKIPYSNALWQHLDAGMYGGGRRKRGKGLVAEMYRRSRACRRVEGLYPKTPLVKTGSGGSSSGTIGRDETACAISELGCYSESPHLPTEVCVDEGGYGESCGQHMNSHQLVSAGMALTEEMDILAKSPLLLMRYGGVLGARRVNTLLLVAALLLQSVIAMDTANQGADMQIDEASGGSGGSLAAPDGNTWFSAVSLAAAVVPHVAMGVLYSTSALVVSALGRLGRGMIEAGRWAHAHPGYSLGWVLALECSAWVVILGFADLGVNLTQAALGLGLAWLCTIAPWFRIAHRGHVEHRRGNKFLLTGSVLSVLYVHGLAWSSGLSLQQSFALIPPCVSFAIWTASLSISGEEDVFSIANIFLRNMQPQTGV